MVMHFKIKVIKARKIVPDGCGPSSTSALPPRLELDLFWKRSTKKETFNISDNTTKKQPYLLPSIPQFFAFSHSRHPRMIQSGAPPRPFLLAPLRPISIKIVLPFESEYIHETALTLTIRNSPLLDFGKMLPSWRLDAKCL